MSTHIPTAAINQPERDNGSSSPEATSRMKRHPAAIAWEAFAGNNKRLFEGTASGEYLENRLRHAFSCAWDAAERAVTAALKEPR